MEYHFATTLCLSCILAFVCAKPRIFSSSDWLLTASKVRDQDELRLAMANTQIGQWRIENMLPLPLSDMFGYGGKYKFLIVMITSNRGLHKVDAFEPYYLTQSSVTLVKTLISAKSNTYMGIDTIKPVFCAAGHLNDTDVDTFSNEIKRLRRVFGPNAFIRPSQIFATPCKPTFDMVSCLFVGLKNHPLTDYIVLLEDDILTTEKFLPALDIFTNSTKRSFLNLYVPPRTAFSSSRAKAYFSILCFFTAVSLIVACYIVYSRLTRKHIRKLLLFVFVAVAAMTLLKMHISSDSIAIYHSDDPEIDGIGAAVVLPKEVALKLASTDLRTACVSPDTVQSKSNLIKKAAKDLQYDSLIVRPSAVIHIGMYSQFQNSLKDPLLFPH